MNPWKCKEWKKLDEEYLLEKGILLTSETDVSQNIKDEFVQFDKWLLNHFDFPVQLKVYLVNSEKVQMSNGTLTYGIFKYYRKRYPIIKIPVGSGEHNWDIEEIFGSYVHELTHYFQWVNDYEQTDEESERQANYHRFRIVRNYYKDMGRD